MRNFSFPLLATALLLALPFCVRAQGVGIGTSAPDASAALDIVSSAKGALLPRLTAAQRTGIAAPATGLLVFQTDGAQAGFWYYAASGGWTFLNPGGDNLGNHTATQNLNLQGNALVGTGADIGTAVGLGVRADGGLNLGQNMASGDVRLGYQAGAAATTGGNSVFVGYQSGAATTVGSNNVFSGYQSGLRNTTGSANVFVGLKSGFRNISGDLNVFVGYQSGASNTTGNNNYFSGFDSGYMNTTGSENLFIGSGSGTSNTTGNGSLFIGISSGSNTTTDSNNHFVGCESGAYNTTGTQNLFEGYRSGRTNTTGSYNQFVGYYSGYSNITGGGNVCSGYQSGYANTTGGSNTFSGYGSGDSNTSGNYNTFEGTSAGTNNTTGSGNTALGYFTGPSTGGLTNTTCLGEGAQVSGSNTVQLGNAAVTTLRCQVALTVSSDARFKYDVRPDVPGLAFITRLRPVTYRFDTARLAAFGRTGRLRPFVVDNNAAVHTGFLAQEVEQAAKGLSFVFDGVHAPATARDHYSLAYSQFVMPLVKAVQEQQAQIEALKAQNAALQTESIALRTRVAALEAAADQAAADHASLQTIKQQMARLLGPTWQGDTRPAETASAGAQADQTATLASRLAALEAQFAPHADGR